MVNFLYPHGTVYILENATAQRVKVGMSGIGANDAVDRLKDVNDMWLERKVSCQICGGRLMNIGGYVPRHVKSGILCPGGEALPLEKDVAIAEAHLANLKDRHGKFCGTKKWLFSKQIKTLEKRIKKYRQYIQ